MMKKPTRPSADKTRVAILKAAKTQFLKYGFNGASIEQIAKQAKVNTNLIFHHFINKETLWIKVKETVLKKSEPPCYSENSAESFFQSILDHRFRLYEDNPDLVKLIQWQQLTENESALIGCHVYSPNDWLPIIKKLQKKGEITKKIRAEDIMLFIIFSTHAPFMQKIILFDEKQREAYKKMILDMCYQQFLTH